MLRHKTFEKVVLPVGKHIVKAYAGAYENTLHSLDCRCAFKQMNVFRMVGIQIGTWLREEALAVGTGSQLFLLFAGGMAEICCRTADVVNISLEPGQLCQFFDLVNDRILASCGDNPALMERDGTEVARAETASAMSD